MDTTLSRIKELDHERLNLAEEAKAQALQQINAALSLLTALGYNYSLVESRRKGRPPKSD